MKYDRLYNFISPVTGKLPIDIGYTLLGDKEGRSFASPILIDIRQDIIDLKRKIGNFEELKKLDHNRIWIGDYTNEPVEQLHIGIINLPLLAEAVFPNPISPIIGDFRIPNPTFNYISAFDWVMSGPFLPQIYATKYDTFGNPIGTDISSSLAMTQVRAAQIMKRFDNANFIVGSSTVTFAWENPKMYLIPEDLKQLYDLGTTYTFTKAQSLGNLQTGLLKNTVDVGTGTLSTAIAGKDYVEVAAPIANMQLALIRPELIQEGQDVAKLLSRVERLPVANMYLTTGKYWKGGENNIPIEVDIPTYAPSDATYIIRTPNTNLPEAQVLEELGTGMVKIIADGAFAIAIAGEDYATSNQLKEIEQQCQGYAEQSATSAAEAATSALEATTAATSATTAATSAITFAGEASASAAAAAASVIAAGISAGSASSSASAAGNSATAAGNSATAAANSLNTLLNTEINLQGAVIGAGQIGSPITTTMTRIDINTATEGQLNISRLNGYPYSSGTFLRGDGIWTNVFETLLIIDRPKGWDVQINHFAYFQKENNSPHWGYWPYSGVALDIMCTTGAVAAIEFQATSSIKKKNILKNINEFREELRQKFDSIDFVQYEWKDKNQEGFGKYFGYIAENLAKDFPELVNLENMDYAPSILKLANIQNIESKIYNIFFQENVDIPISSKIKFFDTNRYYTAIVLAQKNNTTYRISIEQDTLIENNIFVYGIYDKVALVSKTRFHDMIAARLKIQIDETEELKEEIMYLKEEIMYLKKEIQYLKK